MKLKKEFNSHLIIGFIADIYAGDQEYREEDKGNVVFPIKLGGNIYSKWKC